MTPKLHIFINIVLKWDSLIKHTAQAAVQPLGIQYELSVTIIS